MLLTVTGTVLSAGIGVTTWLYVRAGRQSRQALDGHMEVEIAGRAHARIMKWWEGRIDFRARASGRHGTRDGQSSEDHEPDYDIFGTVEEVDELELLQELEQFRRTYTLHEVAAYYAAMSDEDLGIDRTDRDISPPDPGTKDAA